MPKLDADGNYPPGSLPSYEQLRELTATNPDSAYYWSGRDASGVGVGSDDSGIADASVVEVMSVPQKGFRPIGDARPGVQVLMLQLGTGEAVALLGSYGFNEKVVLLTDAIGDAAQIVEHFRSATGFPAEQISTIDPGGDECR